MLKDNTDELKFGEVIEAQVATKHVAAGAFVSIDAVNADDSTIA